MKKRILSLVLCLLMVLPSLASCSSANDDDPGSYITMYLTDNIYDFDPINAYNNADAVNVLSMMYDTLFTLDKNGKIKPSLAKSYKVVEKPESNEYYMDITLKNTCWSTKDAVTSNDVVFAWKRLLKSGANIEAASLLFDIKNARAVNQGDLSIDLLGVDPIEDQKVRIYFEGPINYDLFLLNLTSLATAPLLDRYVSINDDWAKKSSTIATSGPFKLGKIVYADILDEKEKNIKVDDNNAQKADGTIGSSKSNAKKVSYFYLERNAYYNRDTTKDAIDKVVKSYRLLVDCRLSAEELLTQYNDGKINYIGNIPLSLRADETVKKKVKVSDALSTFVLSMNENAEIGGQKLFANAKVRQALSLAIDRDAIAEAVVYAKAATALVPYGVFDKGTSGQFRTSKNATNSIATTANLDGAKQLLSEANINPASFTFSIKVASYDEVHVLIANMVKDAWSNLGFKVSVTEMMPIQNNDYFPQTDSIPDDVCDDTFIEAIQSNNYEVAAFDFNAYTADAYSVLSKFAAPFSGMMLVNDGEFSTLPNATGYQNAEYDDLMEAIFYLPYFANLPADPDEKLFADDEKNPYIGWGIASKAEYVALYQKLAGIYEKYGITPAKKASKWAEQRSILLHKAEEMLLNDLPVIPVIFNQNAQLVGKKISGVSKTYYCPAYFVTTKLKGYNKLTYIDARGNERSIFADFPNINWELVGTDQSTKTAE